VYWIENCFKNIIDKGIGYNYSILSYIINNSLNPEKLRG
jgi:hypothetical protein